MEAAGSTYVPPPEGSRRKGLLVGVLVGGVVVALLAALLVWSPWSNEPAAQAAELWLEPATSTGDDPFTDSTDNDVIATTTTVATTTTAPTSTTGPAALETVAGSTPALYGGTQSDVACDVEQQIAFLQANPDKAAAFASVLGIAVIDIPDYLRNLRPVVLTRDTRVTNHGFVDGVATPRQAVLQAGTAVLIDRYGIPRVRCRCGNPLLPPLRLDDGWGYYGDGWDGFRLDDTIVIDIDIEIDILILLDLDGDGTLEWPWDDDWWDHHDGSSTTTSSSSTTTSTIITEPFCAATPEGAIQRLLEFRLAGDRTGAMLCGAPPVLEYLWRLSTDFVAGLTVTACEEPAMNPYPGGAFLCTLSNGVQLVVEAPGGDPAMGFIVVAVIVVDGGGRTDGTGGGTTGTGGGSSSTAGGTAEQAARGLFQAWQSNSTNIAENWATQQATEQLFGLGRTADGFSSEPRCEDHGDGSWYCSFPGIPPQAGAIYMKVEQASGMWLVTEAFFGGGV
ncbi:MAG: hypothetical protein IPM45_04360 [Acidimicrobiales bacterium]|nr:hypothetical protein [Acidimicrobiales bacterium]